MQRGGGAARARRRVRGSFGKPGAAGEQLGAAMALQHADAVAGGGGDAELLAGEGEPLVPGGGLEDAQALERRQGNHGLGRREPWGWS